MNATGASETRGRWHPRRRRPRPAGACATAKGGEQAAVAWRTDQARDGGVALRRSAA
jgi:hypothetical protein